MGTEPQVMEGEDEICLFINEKVYKLICINSTVPPSLIFSAIWQNAVFIVNW